MLRFVIVTGSRDSLKIADIEKSLASYRDGAYELIQIDYTPGYSVREIALARARHGAFHWKNRASMFFGLASGKEYGKRLVNICAVNAAGEEGETILWSEGNSPARKSDDEVITWLTTSAITQFTLWLKLMVPPVAPLTIEHLHFSDTSRS